MLLFVFQMISTRYASFISGIAIASLTWAFSLYLYSKLSQNASTANPTVFVSDVPHKLKESVFNQKTHWEHDAMLRDNEIYGYKKNGAGSKDPYNLKGMKNFKNSEKLIKHLQAVTVRPAVTLGYGTVQFLSATFIFLIIITVTNEEFLFF